MTYHELEMHLGSQPQKYTRLVKEWLQKEPERIQVRDEHIEDERIWREIFVQDVFEVLSSGEVVRVRESDTTLIWQGMDEIGRTLELLCALVSVNGVDTLIIHEATTLRVGTAYQPGIDDDQLKAEWLSDNPDYELTPKGEVKKKVGKKL